MIAQKVINFYMMENAYLNALKGNIYMKIQILINNVLMIVKLIIYIQTIKNVFQTVKNITYLHIKENVYQNAQKENIYMKI